MKEKEQERTTARGRGGERGRRNGMLAGPFGYIRLYPESPHSIVRYWPCAISAGVNMMCVI